MALLQLLSEEEIGDDGARDYADILYRIVCVGERPALDDRPGGYVRSTYVVDWEQLVHLLEDYQYFGEDIVEVAALPRDQARAFRTSMVPGQRIARA
jgi:hypothetical protein